jgi:Protein of unknown function (DUF1286)
MRIATHDIFSAGLLYAFLSPPNFFGPRLLAFLVGVVLSFSVNHLIDGLGHRRRDGRPVRTPLTHSVLTAPLWGAGAGYAVYIAVEQAGLGGRLGLVGLVVAGVLAAYSHLLLDSVTEGGVFVLTKRVAIAHFRSRNRVLNGAFVLLGLMMFVLPAMALSILP